MLRKPSPPPLCVPTLFAPLLVLVLVAGSARAQCPTLPAPGSFSGDTDFQTVKSQMWINGNTWWGAFSDASSGVYFYQKVGNNFVKGALIDTNPIAQADTLWNGTNLFIVMFHSGSLAKFYKYTYNTGSQTYSLMSGFPLNLPLTGMATHAVLAQDSTGKLWVTYTGSGSGLGGDGNVRVIWSTNAAHTAWNTTGFVLESNLTPFTTEVSAIVAFGSNKIGVFWTNQALGEDGFRVHNDADSETTWSAKEIVDSGQGVPGIADDHASIAAHPDGRIFVVTKDGILDGHLNLYVRSAAGAWSPRIQVNNDVGAVVTRPVLMLNTQNNRAYVVYRNTGIDPGIIQISSIDMTNPTVFGPACSFIATQKSNNPTGTKQHLNNTTDLIAVTSQDGLILHQTLDLSAAPTASFNASATSGNAPLAVNFTDTSFDDGGVVSWNWNFGDGFTSNVQNPSHVFRAGSFNVSLQVVDASGNSATANVTINVTDINVPVIQNISPSLVVFNSGSFTLTVDGADFNAGSQIRIGGSPRTTTIVNATRVTAVMPATDSQTLGTFPITVTNSGGTSNAVNLVVTADAPFPHLSSISPVETAVGSSGLTLTVTGTAFSSTSKVFWNNSERPTTFVSSTQLTAQIPSSDLAEVTYQIPVYVITPPPGGGQTPETQFFNVRPVCAVPPTPIQFTGSTEFNTVKSQMWHHDGTWWGVFSDIDPSGIGTGLSIYKKSGSAMNKGQLIDPNVFGIPDVLWDGTNLFVMVLENAAEGEVVIQQEAKFYKFSYNSGPQTYTLLAGFPVTIPLQGLAASLQFDKDSTGKLWATYTGTNVDLGLGDRNVRVIWSTNAAHTSWNSNGLVLESNLTALTTEVSSVIPFGGNKIGIAWSNHELDEYGFRFHVDGEVETLWSAKEIIDDGTLRIDDHISMKASADGRIFMAAKDGIGDGHVQLYIRTAAGVWLERIPVNLDPNVFATRPVTILDTTNDFLYIVYRDSNSLLLYSRMPLNGTSFDPACPFIADAVNNPTSTKQNVNGNTELFLAARGGGPILLGHLALPGGPSPTGPAITSLAPSSVNRAGPAFTLTVNGSGFVSGATVSINGTNRTTTFVNATQLTAQILASDIASAGTFPIRVTNPSGGGASPTLDLSVTNPAPLLTGAPPLSPATATAGTGQFTLTLNGSNFVPTSVVRWNGTTPAADRPTTFVSSTQLTATISAADIASGGLRPVRVFNPGPGGGTSGAQTFTVNNPVPATTSMSPATACNGGGAFTLTVNGTGFVSGAIVRWNGVNRTTTFFSPTELHAQINASDIATAGSASVTVFNPTPGGGTSSPALNFVTTGSCVNPSPTITSISPDTRAVASGPFTLTVNGSNFVANSVVRFNAIDRTTIFVSANQLTAQILASDIAVGGLYPISVFSPGPGGGTTTNINLTVTNPAPTLTSIFPPAKEIQASSLSLICNGSNFVSDSVGRFNGNARATIFISSTQIEMQLLPADITVAGVFPITVFNPAPGGGNSTSQNLTLNNPAPTLIGALAPQIVTMGSGAVTVNIPGEGFYSGSVVRFNGTTAAANRPTTFVTSELLQVQLTAADTQTTGVFPIIVFNATPGGGTSNALNFTVGNPLPTTTSLSPANRNANAGQFTLTVNGTNFISGAVVTFSGINMATTFVNSTQLTAIIPAAQTATGGVYPVRVANPAPGGGLSPLPALDLTVDNPVPTINAAGGLAPATVTAGDPAFILTVNGTNFISTSVINFNGSPRTTTFVSATQLTTTISAADIQTGGTFAITVTNPPPGGGTSTPASTLTVNNPIPTINATGGLVPDSVAAGGAGFTLTINGVNFVPGSVVRWNGTTPAADRPTTFVNSTQLTATISAADIATAGIFPVNVFNPGPAGGTSGLRNLTVTNPAPTINSISPASALSGGAQFTLTVDGSGFISPSVVNFNGSPRTTTFVSATQLTAIITAADIQTGGAFPITVTNPPPGGGTSASLDLAVGNPVPALTSLSPNSTLAGGTQFTLTINGTNFISNSVVRWNGVDRTTSFVSATQLTTTVSAAEIAAAGIIPITVFNPAPAGGTSGALDFTVNNPAPTVSGISPITHTAGAGEFNLTVNGTGFVSTSVVQLNGVNKATTFVSGTQLQAIVPAADTATGGTLSVTVVTPAPGGGTSTPAISLTVNNPSPSVTSIAPNTVVAGSAGFTLTLNGTNFVAGSIVRVDGLDRGTTFVNSTQLTTQISAADIAAAGTHSITVFNPAPGGGVSVDQTLTINNPVPSIAGLSPSQVVSGGPAFTLTVNGTGFMNGSVVRLNGSDRTTTFVSSTQLTAAITSADVATSATLSITVFNASPGGGESNSANLSVTNPPPTLSNLAPSSVTAGGAQFTLTVTGTNFVNGATVNFNGQPRTTAFASSTELSAQITATDIQTSGIFPITVSNPAPGGGTSAHVDFTVTNPVPTITNINPTSASAGNAAFVMTVTGTGFVSGTVLRFGGADRTTTFVSATQLTAQITAADIAAPGVFPVAVFNPAPGGGTSSAINFNVNPNIPVINSLSPATATAGGAQFTLTVNGANFVNGSIVRFDGTDRPTNFISATQLEATITAANIAVAGTFSITVINPAPGGVSNSLNLSVTNPAPTLTSVSPTNGLAGGAAFPLNVTGTNFVPTSVVRWNGSNRTTVFVSSTELQATITSSDIANGGTVSVTVFTPTPGGGSSAGVNFAINNPAPILNGLAPASAVAGGPAFTLTVNGSNFVGSSVVRWNGVDRATTFVSSTILQAQITGADIATLGSASVTVFTPAPAGGTSTEGSFSIGANPRIIRVVAASSGPATTMNVPIELISQGDENAIGFTLTFDAALLANPQASLGNAAVGGTLNINSSEAAFGRFGIIVSLPTGQTFTAGTRQIVVISFTTANTTAATEIGFGDQPVIREVSNVNADILPAVFTPQTVNIQAGFEADVAPRPNGNVNGTVSVADWVLVGRFAAGLDVVTLGSEFQRADCSPRQTFGNGTISVSDWVQAGRYAAGLDPVAPVAGPTGPSSAASMPLKDSKGFSALVDEERPAHNTRVVSFTETTLQAGRVGAVKVVLNARGDENALGFSLSFDPRTLRFVSASAGVDAGDATLHINADEVSRGHLGIAAALPTGRTFLPGMRELVVLNFQPVKNSSGKTTLKFDDSKAVREVADVAAQTAAVDFREGIVNIEPAAAPPTVQFGAESYTGPEGGAITVNVIRTGDLSTASSVAYQTKDGEALQKSDYTTTAGTLRFAPGESVKTFTLLLTSDSYAEARESFGIGLSDPVGAVFGPVAVAAVRIENIPSPSSQPVVEETEAFVRQHYHDFLGREPDAAGLRFWVNEIEQCGADPECREEERANVSAAFFHSVEFQETGFLAYRLAQASFNRLPRFNDFVRDAQALRLRVIVGQVGWERQLELNRRDFAEEWTARPEFRARYDGLSNEAFVQTLLRNAGVASAPGTIRALVNALERNEETRGSLLLHVTENAEFKEAQFNRAFVLMQYFGYLRRDPEAEPDGNMNGFEFWLRKLNQFGGNYQRAEMVKAFLSATEYRARFCP